MSHLKNMKKKNTSHFEISITCPVRHLPLGSNKFIQMLSDKAEEHLGFKHTTYLSNKFYKYLNDFFSFFFIFHQNFQKKKRKIMHFFKHFRSKINSVGIFPAFSLTRPSSSRNVRHFEC